MRKDVLVPKGWKRRELGGEIDLLTGYAFKSGDYRDTGVRLLRGNDVAPGKVDWEDVKRVPEAVLEGLDRFALSPGDCVIALDRTWISAGAKVAVVKADDVPSYLVQRVARIRALKSASQSYVNQLLFSEAMERLSQTAKTETAVPHISPNDIRDLVLLIPPLPEQRRIAEILGTWDRAIAVQEALIRTAEAQKTALMQQLLTPTRRLPGFEGEWEEVRLGDLFERVKTKNKGTSDNALTISAQMGLVSQEDYFNKRVAADNLANYTLLQRGDFAYNKSYSTGYPMGAIKPLKFYEQGVVSTLYICFRLKPSDNSHAFYRHYFEGGFFNREIAAFAQEGARNHGLLNIAIGDFFNGRIAKPSADEQGAIAKVLAIAEADIAALSQTLTHLRAEKTALMQQLLTGKRRVRVEDAA